MPASAPPPVATKIFYGVIGAIIIGLVVVIVALLGLAIFFPGHFKERPPWKDVPVSGAPGSTAPFPDDIAEDDRFDPVPSAIVAGACLGPLLVLAGVYARRARAHRREAARAAHPAGACARALWGIVEPLDDDAAAPIELRVDQAGTSSSYKGTTSHRWTETKREVVARPFDAQRLTSKL